MASTSLQGITSSPPSPPEYIHDVFLSFRGKDTRNNFTSHLHSNLKQKGIDVYMDDKKLERGKTIEPALWKAIEESRFSVVVFSRNYAFSPWCLDELVKIVQCMKEMGHTVLPVFYDVDPSLVAEQKGRYEKAFVQHEENFKENLEKVRSWKDCLTTVANLSGWDVRNRNESESINIIVEYIFYKLSVAMPTISKNLVGIDSRLEVLNGYIGEEVGKPIFIGVCGMGGIGKTTVARVVYDRIRWQFDGSCFLANVREVFAEKDGPRRLHEQLLSEILMERATVWDSSRRIDMIRRRLRLKKILLILDDVEDQKQLEFLAAEHGWFGPGSRIIITSRDKKVLTKYDDARIYEAEKLNDDDALMLFSQKAFKNYQPAEDFTELSKQVVGYANGLPLALEVIGSFLHGRDIQVWGSAIDRLNEIPNREIIAVLRISFDGLEEFEKKIFLDIACFLKGFKKDRIIRILNGCGFYAEIGTKVLIEKSLISVSRDQVWMHNLLQIMGKEIVRCESPDEPGRRSRLWTYQDVYLAVMDNTGKEKIEAIFLDMPGIIEAQWNMKAFSKMIKLRLLKIINVQLSEGPEDLSNMLRFLEWHFYPSKSLPTGLQMGELVELHMPNSSVEQLWYGNKSAHKLEIIDLSNSLSLVRTPDFTSIPNLKRLILEGCTSLYKVHPSFGHHKKLQYVNLVNCISITTLPSNLEMESLQVFSLDGCSKLKKFPDIVGNMNKLMKLRLDKTGITEISSWIHHLVGLDLLSMNSCKKLTRIPKSIGGLKSLKKLDLSDCSGLEYITHNLGEVESLEVFDLSGTSIEQLPASISLLKNLKELYLDGCKRIVVLPSLSGLCSLEVLGLRACNLREGALPKDIGCLSSLMSLDLSQNNFVSLPRSINELSELETLVLEDCRMLESLLEVPSKVQTVNLNGCISLKEIPDPIKLCGSKRSKFLCINCWELYKPNDQDNMGFTMLERYLQGLSNPRPGFGIVVPGNEIPGWFNYQKKGSSISVQVHSWSMGFVACVAFSASGESPSLSCHFKENGREIYPSPMDISYNSIQVVSDHLWLFYLSFDYLKELTEWQHESFNNIELSFHSSERVKVKNYGVFLLYSPHTLPSKFDGIQYDIPVIRGADTSNAFTHLSTAPALRGTIPDDKESEKVMAIRSRLLKAIEESGVSIIIFARDCESLTWCFDELVKMVGFMDEMRPNTIVPVSNDVKQSMNILTGVESIPTEVESDDKHGPESLESSIEAPPTMESLPYISQLSRQVQPLERFQQFQHLQHLKPLLQQSQQSQQSQQFQQSQHREQMLQQSQHLEQMLQQSQQSQQSQMLQQSQHLEEMLQQSQHLEQMLQHSQHSQHLEQMLQQSQHLEQILQQSQQSQMLQEMLQQSQQSQQSQMLQQSQHLEQMLQQSQHLQQILQQSQHLQQMLQQSQQMLQQSQHLEQMLQQSQQSQHHEQMLQQSQHLEQMLQQSQHLQQMLQQSQQMLQQSQQMLQQSQHLEQMLQQSQQSQHLEQMLQQSQHLQQMLQQSQQMLQQSQQMLQQSQHLQQMLQQSLQMLQQSQQFQHLDLLLQQFQHE